MEMRGRKSNKLLENEIMKTNTFYIYIKSNELDF